ncbi:hypothetical protein YWY31_50020 [Paenibacillus illinoisensis]
MDLRSRESADAGSFLIIAWTPMIGVILLIRQVRSFALNCRTISPIMKKVILGL